VLCLIVVPLPPGKNPFAVYISNNKKIIIMQAGNRTVGWPLYAEVAPTQYSLLGKRHLRKIWAQREILLCQSFG
jgi:hypothetical protein